MSELEDILDQRRAESDQIETLLQVADEIVRLSAAAKALLERLERFARASQSLIKLLQVDTEFEPATRTVHVRLGAKPSDRAARLVAALRAGKINLMAVGVELDHLASPLGSFGDDPGEERESPAGVESPPAADASL